MAKASGKAADGLVTGDFFHQPSEVHYRVFSKDFRTWMSYQRDGEPKISGQKELLYYIGSGRKGRSYVFSVQGFLFESPINWYSQEGRWNMAPAYTEARQIPMNLPLLIDCLICHASGVQPPIAGTENRYAGKPFLHDGISCERCHGPGTAHAQGKGAIVNPAKLPPERRDSVCMECHFEGTVAIEQPGKKLYQFQPGEDLSDYIHYFLLADNNPKPAESLSQTEALSLSMCKRKSGDKMSCMSCHDPHYEPSAAERVAYFRGKCLACHGDAFGAKHHPKQPDCTSCHMPQLPSKDVAHTEATDHRILRVPGGNPVSIQLTSLVPHIAAFPESSQAKVSNRDLGLAWEELAQRNVQGAAAFAEEFLQKAVAERPDDAPVLVALGYNAQKRGSLDEAQKLFERALKADPLSDRAATDLGVIEARTAHLSRAVELWQSAFDRAPHRSAIGINLAIAFCDAGQADVGRKYVQRVLDFNPDFTEARQLLNAMNADPPRCKP